MTIKHQIGGLLVAAFLLAACGGGQPEADTSSAEGTAPVASTAQVSGAPEAPTADGEAPAMIDETTTETEEKPMLGSDAVTTDSGLKYEDLTVGDGAEAGPNTMVTVNYTGWLENGTQFDSSLNREPFTFPLGAGGVIAGWDEGVEGMKVGGKRLLEVPADLAYGEQGAGGVIPPDATLTFEVELLSVEDQPTPAEVDTYQTTEGGTQYAVLEEGDGATTAKEGDLISIDYSAWLKSGVLFNSSAQAGQPTQFPVGQSGLLGLDEAVTGMKVGETRQILIETDPAEVEAGTAPEGPLTFEVTLLEVTERPTLSLAPEFTKTESGLEYAVLQEGSGAVAEAGNSVTVDYSGWLEDGTLFDSSVERGQPFPFVLGQGQVIAGWDEGVAGMKVGEKRQLRIPADLAYGEAGSPPTIPPNSTLIFDVELLDVTSEGQ